MQNISVSGTFQKYMESVKTEVQRQLGCDYAVQLVNMGLQRWSTAHDTRYLTYKVEIFDNEGWYNFFVICENEYLRNKPESRIELARVRFVDAEWGLEYAKERASV